MHNEDNLMLDKLGTCVLAVYFHPSQKYIGTENEIMSSWQTQTFVVACDTVSGTGGDLLLTILDQIWSQISERCIQ